MRGAPPAATMAARVPSRLLAGPARCKQTTMVLGIVLSMLVTHAGGCTQPYSPTGKVEQYSRFQFEMSQAYAQRVVLYSLPLAVIGTIVFVFFALWSCARCCRRCKRPINMDSGWRAVLTCVLVAVVVALAGLVFFGVKVDHDQTVAVAAVQPSLQRLTVWQDQTVGLLRSSSFNTALLAANLSELHENEDPGHTYTSEGHINALNASFLQLEDVFSVLNTTVAQLDLGSLEGKVEDRLEQYDAQRHQFMFTVLVALITLTGVACVLSLLDAYAPDCAKPGRRLPLLAPLLGFVYHILLLGVWISAFAVFALTTSVADFCVNADHNVLKTTGLAADSVTSYYFLCDENTTMTHPLATRIVIIEDALSLSSHTLDNMESSLPNNCAIDPPCTTVAARLDAISEVLASVQSDIGLRQHALALDSGLTELLQCNALNSIYHDALNLSCDKLMTTIARTFEVCLSFAILMSFAELLRRLLPFNESVQTLRRLTFIPPHTSNKIHPRKQIQLLRNSSRGSSILSDGSDGGIVVSRRQTAASSSRHAPHTARTANSSTGSSASGRVGGDSYGTRHVVQHLTVDALEPRSSDFRKPSTLGWYYQQQSFPGPSHHSSSSRTSSASSHGHARECWINEEEV
eukprot:m.126479 g.126479  ORF g.126479 m.126479 type:complete len:632 (+) comp9707_c0_seq3:152-2047(+)